MADLKPHFVTIDRLQKEGVLTWLHLSDIHFGGPDADGRPAVLNRLLQDLEERKTQDGLIPDLIFITGDIAWSGKAEQYRGKALPFIEELQKTTGVERNRIFLIPGNHDIDRSLAASQSLHLLSDHLLAEGSKENEKAISAFLYGSDTEDRERILRKHSAYIDFVKEHFPHCAPLFDPCAYVAKVTVPAGLPFEKLWVLGLNSAWLSREGEGERKLLLGYNQVQKALNFIESEKSPDKDFIFALTHHPLSWMADWDERLCKQQLSQRTDFHLSGHLHEHAFSLNAVGPQRYSSIAAGSAYGDGGMQWYNGYYFTQLDFTTGNARAYIRQYNPNAIVFRPDTTFNSPLFGQFEWKLSNKIKQINNFNLQTKPTEPSKSNNNYLEENLDVTSNKDFDNEELGLFDILEQFDEQTFELTEISDRIVSSLNKLTEKINLGSAELQKTTASKQTASAKEIKKSISKIAISMNQFSEEMKNNLPIFNSKSEQIIILVNEFTKLIIEMDQDKESISNNLEKIILLNETLKSLEEAFIPFKSTVESLSRVTSEFQKSKRGVVIILQNLLGKVRKNIDLLDEAEARLRNHLNSD